MHQVNPALKLRGRKVHRIGLYQIKIVLTVIGVSVAIVLKRRHVHMNLVYRITSLIL